MEGRDRVVIVDPAYASDVGHHADVNAQLLAALGRQGWTAECWGDAALNGNGCRGVFRGCGYIDPRHWADLSGTVHLAGQLERQIVNALDQLAAEGAMRVVGWVMHTALPFQLLGLSRALRRCSAATVVVSLMFPPGETLGGEGGVEAAVSNCRVALGALAHAIEEGGHQLRLELPSQQSLELYSPLLATVALECSGLHPAVVGAGLPVKPDPGANDRPRILLHWGDLKAGKGRRQALEVVSDLLDGRPGLPGLEDVEWLFHLYSREILQEHERTTLERAHERVNGFQWLNERVDAGQMQAILAGCDGALLAYDPVHYRERSSGLLWCYGAARLISGKPAAVAGMAGSWLEREAQDLGLNWHSGTDGRWLETLMSMVRKDYEARNYTTYGDHTLGRRYADHVTQLILAAQRVSDQ